MVPQRPTERRDAGDGAQPLRGLAVLIALLLNVAGLAIFGTQPLPPPRYDATETVIAIVVEENVRSVASADAPLVAAPAEQPLAAAAPLPEPIPPAAVPVLPALTASPQPPIRPEPPVAETVAEASPPPPALSQSAPPASVPALSDLTASPQPPIRPEPPVAETVAEASPLPPAVPQAPPPASVPARPAPQPSPVARRPIAPTTPPRTLRPVQPRLADPADAPSVAEHPAARRRDLQAEAARARAAADRAAVAAQARAEARAASKTAREAARRDAASASSRDGETRSAEAAGYGLAVVSRIAAMKRYPEAARDRGAQGTAVVSFSIGSGGDAGGITLARSSGDAALDAEALATVRRASPFPPPPVGASRRFSAPIAFHAR